MASFKRITIAVPNELDQEIRNIQAELLVKECRTISWTDALFYLTRKGLESIKEGQPK